MQIDKAPDPPVTSEFTGCETLAQKLEVVTAYEYGNLGNLCVAGELLTDLARQNVQDPSLTEELLQRAYDDYKLAIDLNEIDGNLNPHAWSKAALGLVMMPQLESLILPDRPQDESVASKVYKELVQIAVQLAEVMRQNSSYGDRKVMIGDLAELSILLLLQRQSLEIGNNIWLPLPSFWSEDRQPKGQERGIRKSWDISVYSRLTKDLPMNLTYKIQVKSKVPYLEQHNKRYEDDIAVVFLKEDMRLEGEESCRSYTIPEETFAEQYRGNPDNFKQNLDSRAYKLLEILDQ